MRRPHRRLDVGVTQHFLDGPQVLGCPQCPRRTRVTHVVDPEVFEPCFIACSCEGGPPPLIADRVALASLVALAALRIRPCPPRDEREDVRLMMVAERTEDAGDLGCDRDDVRLVALLDDANNTCPPVHLRPGQVHHLTPTQSGRLREEASRPDNRVVRQSRSPPPRRSAAPGYAPPAPSGYGQPNPVPRPAEYATSCEHVSECASATV